MKKAKKLVVGNWKMNPLTLDEAKRIASTVKRRARLTRRVHTVICPPYLYISPLQSVSARYISLGAQDGFYETLGHFTGEVSSSQLPQFNVNFVIVGHSERRLSGETDIVINKKIRSVIGNGMTAILCIGEKIRDHQGDYLDVIKKQIHDNLKDVSKRSLERLVIAYEPVWAVGASNAMRPQEIHEIAIYIRKILRDMYGILADDVPILYGGDVTVDNVLEIVRDGNVSGILVGRESLRAKDFVEIIKIVDSI